MLTKKTEPLQDHFGLSSLFFSRMANEYQNEIYTKYQSHSAIIKSSCILTALILILYGN